jgi:3-methyladenine DNA glycosylase/8-oxoguanine DNA glycosylase
MSRFSSASKARRSALLSRISRVLMIQYAARELREPDAFPVGDIGLTRAITRLARQPLTSGELLEKAERWRPWRAYAAQHLWASEMPARRTA